METPISPVAKELLARTQKIENLENLITLVVQRSSNFIADDQWDDWISSIRYNLPEEIFNHCFPEE